MADAERPCERAGCPAPGIVGLGQPPEWYCPPHFDKELEHRLLAVDATIAFFKAMVSR